MMPMLARISDQAILLEIAQTDPDKDVRRAAALPSNSELPR
jgi:hypothetical protein